MSSALSVNSWVSLFQKDIVPLDMSVEATRAFFHHLADRGMFESQGGDLWRMTGTDKFPADIVSRLDALVRTDKDVVIPYFLRSSKDLPDVFSLKSNSPSQRTLAPRTVSDLSNLQVVKKIGRQLEPFIEFEKNFIGCMDGPNTSKEDARVLLNYILEKARGKVKPPPWEQLSRRRHK